MQAKNMVFFRQHIGWCDQDKDAGVADVVDQYLIDLSQVSIYTVADVISSLKDPTAKISAKC